MAGNHQRTVYSGTFIHSVELNELDILSDSSIGVDEHGKIAFITASNSVSLLIKKHAWDPSTIRYFPDPSNSTSKNNISFFFPGFLDTHIHASQHPNAGIFGKSTLFSWLETYTFPLEVSLADPKKAEAVYSTCVRTTLSHGTTTAAYYATISVESTGVLARVCRQLGQRAFVGRCVMDNPKFSPDYYRDASAASAVQATRWSAESILAADPTRLVQPIVTPRFALSCSKTSLLGLADIAKELDIPIQTHISENLDEVALTNQEYPEHGSYAAVYHNHGLLGPRTVLAHACHLSQNEVDLIHSTGASVSHCPVSNTSLGSGLCPVRELLDQGITVGLGSDVSGGYSPSILVAAREAGAVSRLRSAPGVDIGAHLRILNQPLPTSTSQAARDRLKLSIEETLHLATRGGATSLGLSDRVGGFEVGKEWDVQYIDLGPELDTEYLLAMSSLDTASIGGFVEDKLRTVRSPGPVQVWKGMGWEERLAKWVHQGDERNVRAVWVRGRMVVENLA